MKTSGVYFVLEWQGVLYIDNYPIIIEEYQSIFVSYFSLQYLENTVLKDLKTLCIVDPVWKKDDVIFVWFWSLDNQRNTGARDWSFLWRKSLE